MFLLGVKFEKKKKKNRIHWKLYLSQLVFRFVQVDCFILPRLQLLKSRKSAIYSFSEALAQYNIQLWYERDMLPGFYEPTELNTLSKVPNTAEVTHEQIHLLTVSECPSYLLKPQIFKLLYLGNSKLD